MMSPMKMKTVTPGRLAGIGDLCMPSTTAGAASSSTNHTKAIHGFLG